MKNNNIRVRFAPSPTGPLHIGGVRTALYNFLFARKHGGIFILRIEDTDQARFVDGAEQYIMESLDWCGIKIDEGIREGGEYGPYRQSDRKAHYLDYVRKLLESGNAYYAFDTPEELDQLRASYESQGETFTYNASTRGRLKNSLSFPQAEWEARIAVGIPYVVRFRIPENEDITMSDLIRGDITVNSSTIDDKVLYKSDGMPTYHLANIVDDHLMHISHVIRGEEWLPSLPLHVLLYRAFGWDEPQFAHLPLLLKPEGKGKLSKRDGDKMGFPVFPLYWAHGETARGYREDGYFPEAFVNMLAMLGWNPGTDQEIFSMDELIEAFSIERVGKSGSRFDPEKARWINHQYMQKKSDAEVAILYSDYLATRGISAAMDKLVELTSMVKERATFVADMWNQSDFFFIAPSSYDESVVKKRWDENSPAVMKRLKEQLLAIDDFSSKNTEEKVKEWISDSSLSMGTVLTLFRLLIVGASRGPHLFDIIAWLGRDETVRRIDTGIAKLSG
ncbi:MAG: glutamate--tRNA ligase [Bacteroidia bacterium]|nr:MAG: glutamate--tRNA ligase [Bacteroidia bacterium]